MASRASSVSSISSRSSVERLAVESEGWLHTPAASVSTNDTEEPMNEQRAEADRVIETVIGEPLLQRSESSQNEKGTADSETQRPVQTHETQYGRRSWYHDWWFWEIAGALLSLGSTVAIVIMLAVYNHQPLPVLRYGITLNTMLSVLSTIAKTSMLLATTESIGQAKWVLFRKGSQSLVDFNTIDEASRGPWGSFQLLCHFLDGRTVLASAGAFIVLASLAVDPFIQQVLSYPSVTIVTSAYEQPSFPSVSVWNISGEVSIWESQSSDPTSALPLDLRAAIYNSLFSLGTADSTLRIGCPTGNCTFDRSDTLGFCSTCNDVTASVTMECDAIPTSETSGGVNCTYSLPDSIDIQIKDEMTPVDYGSATAFSPQFRKTTNMSVVALPRFDTLYGNDPNVVESLSDPEYTSPHPAETVFQGIADPILAFGRVIFNNSLDSLSSMGGHVMPAATECALHWCVKTLDTSIQNGVLNQTVFGTWSNSSALDTSDVHLRPNFTSNAGGNGTANSYYVSPMSNLPLVKFLEDAFTATFEGINLPSMGFTEQELLDLSIFSSDTAQALWYADDLDSLMNNLADRMTDALRNLYSDPVSDAGNLGKVYSTQTYVLVTWTWLILPVGLVFASCMVLIAAIISSSRHQTFVWKSSSLATLFHGLARNEGCNGHSVYRKQMENTAEEMKVQLAEDTNGHLYLVESTQQSHKATKLHMGWGTKWLGTGKQRS